MLNENPQMELTKTESGRDVAQAGALCYRRNENGRVEILFVGSRRNGRWGIPKGHLDEGETSSAAALREAFEEAGVEGVVDKTVFGTFSYRKDTSPNQYHVAVHLLQVSRIADKFPEKDVRKTRWFPLESALRQAAQPGLRMLLASLEGRLPMAGRWRSPTSRRRSSCGSTTT
ncbi:NUDIX hydrolase [Rhizobium leguminosarum]|uniref:NUDIX hydrolase n=1 Tax=Rhizobium leguminosarum TaxID=384 RepID=UPI000FEC7941|nr:NUDIX hydrolase [Rhizobium leguminosarum]RWX26773.1 NUDIX hydrolase [Rhizobium leguminosarum]